MSEHEIGVITRFLHLAGGQRKESNPDAEVRIVGVELERAEKKRNSAADPTLLGVDGGKPGKGDAVLGLVLEDVDEFDFRSVVVASGKGAFGFAQVSGGFGLSRATGGNKSHSCDGKRSYQQGEQFAHKK